jgi:membrane protease YdiL (CAAX protease family)
MALSRNNYFSATLHPWSCLIFVLPLLGLYEGGVLWLGAAQPEALRNGADTWLRWALDAFGLTQLYWAPAILAVFLIGWGWLRSGDRPDDLTGLWIGMTLESVIYAVGLWRISVMLGPLLDALGLKLAYPSEIEPAFEQVVSFLGAGIYEEVLFRLILFSGLVWLLGTAEVPRRMALVLAGVTSAVVFSSAHHAGPYGEPFNGYVFLFRTVAGLFFTIIYQLRGFGVAVGSHAFYDVLVGVLVPDAA